MSRDSVSMLYFFYNSSDIPITGITAGNYTFSSDSIERTFSHFNSYTTNARTYYSDASGVNKIPIDTLTFNVAESGISANKIMLYFMSAGTSSAYFTDVTNYVTITDIDGGFSISNISNIPTDIISDDKETVRFLIYPFRVSSGYTVTATTENVTAGNDNPSTVNEGDTFTLTYTANSGYYIESATANIGTVTISEDKTTVTITGTATENITVNVVGAVITYTLTETLNNVSASTSNTTFPATENTTFNLHYTANSGYYIESATANIGTVTINDEKTGVTIFGTVTENIVVSVNAVQETTTYTVTATTENVTAGNDNPSTVNEGESFTLTYTANSGYYIESATANIGTVTISEDKTTVTITGTATENITVNVVGAVITYSYTVGAMSNCTCNKATGATANINDTITITANDGYYFSSTTYTFTVRGVVNTFTKSDDNTVLTGTVTTAGNVIIDDITATLKPTVTTSAFLHIYQPTESELNTLSQERFYSLTDGTLIDYGENILQLYRCYIPISDDNKSSDNIVLGKLSTNITTTGINSNVIELETTITTNGLYYDSEYSALLYIPNYNTPISIPVSHIFNKTLTIKLQYDLYTNKCQYSLYDNGTMFDCGTFTFGSNIPFRFYENNTITDYNYNPPINNYCMLIVEGENIVNISDVTTEYINGTILNIDSTGITQNDLDELNEIFNRGVYI